MIQEDESLRLSAYLSVILIGLSAMVAFIYTIALRVADPAYGLSLPTSFTVAIAACPVVLAVAAILSVSFLALARFERWKPRLSRGNFQRIFVFHLIIVWLCGMMMLPEAWLMVQPV